MNIIAGNEKAIAAISKSLSAHPQPARPKDRPAETFPGRDWTCLNQSAEAAPMRCMAEIVDVDDVARVYYVNKPAQYHHSMPNCLILPFGAPAGGDGKCVRAGQVEVDVTLLTGQTLAVGDRIAMLGGSWYPRPDPLGQWQVLSIISTGDLNRCKVEWIGETADNKIIDASAIGGGQGVAKRIVLVGFTLDTTTYGAPGVS